MRILVLTIFILSGITSCTVIEEKHGVSLREASLDSIGASSNKGDVKRALGSPSTKSTFGQDVWYYISNQTERRIFSENEMLDQQVLALSFGYDDNIENIELYGLKDGRKFDFSERTTPTAGHDLTVIEQLLGNVGRFNAESLAKK